MRAQRGSPGTHDVIVSKRTDSLELAAVGQRVAALDVRRRVRRKEKPA